MKSNRILIAGIALLTCILLTAFVPSAVVLDGPVNAFHFYSNVFFVNIAFMGDAIFAFAVVFFLLFVLYKKDAAFQLLFNLLLLLLIIQTGKILFNGNGTQLYFEAGNSGAVQYIISSHAALAYMLAAFFSFRTNNILFKILLFSLSALVGFSQVYFSVASIFAISIAPVPALLSVIITDMIRGIKGDNFSRTRLPDGQGSSQIKYRRISQMA